MKSGKPYSLVEIFSENNRMIIPDLQRDYCWGTVDDLAKNFTGSLIELYVGGAEKQASLGLIYAYENPPNFINIADGQQRLTSLYLLLCVLYPKIEGSAKELVGNFLALDTSKEIREPRLRYEVRESTLYFMKDFLNKTVFGGEAMFRDLSQLPWFREEYKSDPSVSSMIKAVQQMDEAVGSCSDLGRLSRFLLGSAPEQINRSCIVQNGSQDDASLSRLFAGYSGICFIYFDVRNRDFGEQMYVIINTRGAPMEPNEHIKPLLISKLNEGQKFWTEKWEGWQDFFWKNKKDDELSADEGFNDFLTWYVQIKKTSESPNVYEYFAKQADAGLAKPTLLDLEVHYNQLITLWGYFSGDDPFLQIFNQVAGKDISNPREFTNDQIRYIVLPLLMFLVKHSCNENLYYQLLKHLRRNLFDFKWSNLNRPESYSWQKILKWIEESITPLDLVTRAEWQDDDFIWRKEWGARKELLELENHQVLGGRIPECFWRWIKEDEEKFRAFYLGIKAIPVSKETDPDNLFRRALLSYGDYTLDESSRKRTFIKAGDWHRLLFTGKEDKLRLLLQFFRKVSENLEQEVIFSCKSIIDKFDVMDWRYPLVKDASCMKYSGQCYFSLEQNYVALLSKERRSSYIRSVSVYSAQLMEALGKETDSELCYFNWGCEPDFEQKIYSDLVGIFQRTDRDGVECCRGIVAGQGTIKVGWIDFEEEHKNDWLKKLWERDDDSIDDYSVPKNDISSFAKQLAEWDGLGQKQLPA